MLSYVLLGIAVALSIGFIIFQRPKYPFISLALKGLASLAVVAAALIGFVDALGSSVILDSSAIYICLGLAACMLGDVFLAQLEFNDAKYAFRVRAFGMLAFTIAMCSFFVFFVQYIGDSALFALIVGVILALLIFLISQLLGLKFGKLFAIVIAYSFAIGTVLGAAIINLVLSLKAGIDSVFAPFAIIFAAAMLLFLISDLVLSLIYFGPKQPANRKLYYVNYAFYYAAIIAIASSLIFVL
ncbi:MAG: lysoplasmalogenase [Firmicutes bacterium]|nr:lysoplasmalogenase [Bacillota bacterium]